MLRSPNGLWVPPSRVGWARGPQYAWDACTEPAANPSLPLWLEASAGTPSWSVPPSGPGRYTLTTGAVNGNQGVLRTTQTFDMAHYDAMELTVEGLKVDTEAFNRLQLVLCFLPDGATAGGSSIIQAASVGDPTMRVYNGGANYGRVMKGFSLRNTSPKNITLRMDKRRRLVQILSDGEVIDKLVGTTMPTAVVRARVEVTTGEDVAHSMTISAVSMRLWRNG